MKKRMFLISLILLSIFLISLVHAFSFSDFYSKITGKVTTINGCTETDEGVDFTTRGTIKLENTGESSDMCGPSGDWLTEYVCRSDGCGYRVGYATNDNQILGYSLTHHGENCNLDATGATYSHNCAVDGKICSKGRCIDPLVEEKCIPNWDCTEWGECKSSYQSRECTDLNNCYTSQNQIEVPLIQQCTGSISFTCADSDGGINYPVQGIIQINYSDGSQSGARDYCDNTLSPYGKILAERYCDETVGLNIDLHECQFECRGGACTEPSVEICDGLDNNYDGYKDEVCDKDNDGYADATILCVNFWVKLIDNLYYGRSCSTYGNDCDDTNPNINPKTSNNDCTPPLITDAKISPNSGGAGTVFTITVNITDISGVLSNLQLTVQNPYALIQNPDESIIATVILYDDGMSVNGDLNAEDGVYSGKWTVPTSPLIGKYFVDVFAEDNLGNLVEKENILTFTLGDQTTPIHPSLEVSVATLKDVYRPGEQIYLTDPTGFPNSLLTSNVVSGTQTIQCTDSDNSPDLMGFVDFPISPEKHPYFFTKGIGKGDYLGSDVPVIYGNDGDNDVYAEFPSGVDYSTIYDYCVGMSLTEAYCTSDGKLSTLGINCPNGCDKGICIAEEAEIKEEKLTCIFEDSLESNNKCFLSNIDFGVFEQYECSGEASCNFVVKGPKSNVLVASSCYNGPDLKFINLDGTDETVTFDCGVSTTAFTTTQLPTNDENEERNIFNNLVFTSSNYLNLNISTTQRSFSEANLFEGYIIQLKEEPLISKKIELEITAEKNAYGMRNFFAEVFAFILPKRFEPTLPSNIQDKIQIHINDIQQEHQDFKSKALQSLGRIQITGSVVSSPDELVVLGEYEKTFNGIALNITTEEAESLKELSEVREVYPNYKVYTTLIDSVPLINADDVWQLDSNGNNCVTSGQECLTGKGITIGIIDTGIDYTHGDLGGCFGDGCKVISGWDFVNNDNDPMDDQGHGTHVAATAAGNGVLKGVAPNASIVAYKVLDEWGRGYQDDVIAAIERSADPNQDGDFSDHLDIVSLSLGGFGNPDDPTSQAIDNVVDVGVVAVVAAGNSGQVYGTINSPGTAKKAITVGASYKNGYITMFSSRGPVIWKDSNNDIKSLIKPDLIAPGYDICAAGKFFIDQSGQDIVDNFRCLDNEHITISGTSMATPHVAGAVALLLQKNPGWTPGEIKMALKNDARINGTKILLSYDKINPTIQGKGQIDVLESIQSKKPPIAILEPIEAMKNGGFIDIKGTAKDENFVKYILYYGYSETNIPSSSFSENFNFFLSGLFGNPPYPESWTKISESFTPITDNTLYPGFDISSLSEGIIYFKLVVSNDQNEVSEDYVFMYHESKLKEGWPKSLDYFIVSPLNFGDIDGDGDLEIIVPQINLKGLSFSTSDINAVISVFHHDGSLMMNSPLISGWWPHGSPAVGDIDNDGSDEIVYANNLGVYVLSNKGNSQLASIETDSTYQITLSDINNDGFLNIIVPTTIDEKSVIYVFNNDGSILEGWPKSISKEKYLLYVSVGDINNDGDKELILSGKSLLLALNSDGTILWEIEKQTDHGSNIFSPPILADFDNDNYLDISIFNQNETYSEECSYLYRGEIEAYSNLYVSIFDRQGNLNNQFCVKGSGFIGSVSLYDIEKDNIPEIFLGLGDSYFIMDKNGSILFRMPPKETVGGGTNLYYTPIAGNINNDNIPDLLAVSEAYGFGYFNIEDNSFTKFNLFVPPEPRSFHLARENPPSIVDLDNDGKTELVLGKENFIYVLDLDVPYNLETTDWPMFRHDPQHTGCYNCDPTDETTELPPIVPSTRLQSKIVNNRNVDVSGTLLIKIQRKNNGVWSDSQIVINNVPKTISANDLIKLDAIFNPLNVVVNEVGNYRVYVEFSYGDSSVNANWEFVVV